MVATRAILVLLAIVMLLVMAGANVAMGLDRGVLNDDHVIDQLDDADAYETIHGVLLEELEGEFDDGPDDLPGDIDLSGILEETVTVAYLQSQIEQGISSVYAFIHGDADQIELVVDLEPLIDNLADAVGSQVAETSLAEFGVEPIVVPVDGDAVTIDPAALDTGPAAYDAERAAFESDVKAIIREQIESETGQEPTDEQVDSAYDDLIDELGDEMRSQVTASIDDLDLPAGFDDAFASIATTITDAYTTDLDHDEFADQLEADKSSLGEAAVSHLLDEQEDLIPESIDLAAELDLDEDDLSPAVDAVSLVGTLALVLPLLVLGLVGVMYGVVRDVSPVAKATGVVAVIVGVIGAAIAWVVPGIIESALLDDLDVDGVGQELVDLIPALLGVVFDPLWLQSVGLLILGGVLIGGGIVYDRQMGTDTTPTGTDLTDEPDAGADTAEADPDDTSTDPDDGSDE